MLWNNPVVLTIFWSGMTIAFYIFAKKIHARLGKWWTTPLVITPLLLIALVLTLHVSYHEYIGSTHWLMALLGPATVAFALPIYEQRALIKRRWPVLLVGIVVGNMAAMLSAWGLATIFGLDDSLRLSMIPRSMSTPFAMEVSGDIGGVPDLTAVFVVLTGVFGAVIGEMLLTWVPFKSVTARGAIFGMGAHGAGVAKAHQIGREEGSIAGLVMVLVGLFNVLVAPAVAVLLRQ